MWNDKICMFVSGCSLSARFGDCVTAAIRILTAQWYSILCMYFCSGFNLFIIIWIASSFSLLTIVRVYIWIILWVYLMIEIGTSGFLIMFQRNRVNGVSSRLNGYGTWWDINLQSTFLLHNIETITNCSYRFQQQIEMH